LQSKNPPRQAKTRRRKSQLVLGYSSEVPLCVDEASRERPCIGAGFTAIPLAPERRWDPTLAFTQIAKFDPDWHWQFFANQRLTIRATVL
jgi:hypothetical protein